MKFQYQERGGPYYRVADPDWLDPLDGRPSMDKGGRWTAPGSFPVVYLNRSVSLARLFIAHKVRDLPYGPEDFDPDSGPVLVNVELPSERYVDVVTDSGCAAVGLPKAAWNQDEAGIACRSATSRALKSDEELAWFQRGAQLGAAGVESFMEWFFP